MKNINKLITSVIVAFLISATAMNLVFADTNYGGGETEIINKRFKIEKRVRIEGEDEWEDKVTGVQPDETIEFQIKIKNKSDEEAEDVIDLDNMKMRDLMPDELERTGGSGLTEYWDDFEPGETKTFVIEAKVKDSEFDRDEDFEKCVVNKAEVKWDGEFEGADTATVCYGDVEITELPETGAFSGTAFAGLGLIALGFAINLSKRLA